MINNKKYIEELDKVCKKDFIDWDLLNNKCVFITGSTGLIGSFLTDVLIYRSIKYKNNIHIIANSLDVESYNRVFGSVDKKIIEPYIGDITKTIKLDSKVDYIIHAASFAFPKMFKEKPVETMLGNFIGLNNVLDIAKENSSRILYVSSGEIYGIANDDISAFCEDYQGYVDLLNFRSCYPMSKRASETLLASACKEYDIEGVIVRPSHTFGPTASRNDNRIASSFVYEALEGKDIVLKSSGSQIRSYTFLTDTVSAILCVLVKGNNSEAYNISNPNSIVTIKQLASTIAKETGVELRFDIPSDDEQKNYNKMDLGVLNSDKLLSLGWKPIYNFESGMKRNIEIIKNIGEAR